MTELEKIGIKFDKDGFCKAFNLFLLEKKAGGRPIEEVMNFMNQCQLDTNENILMNIELARILGVMFVVGYEKDFHTFRQTGEFQEYKKYLFKELSVANVEPDVADWLVNGDVGQSSLYLASVSGLFEDVNRSHSVFKMLASIPDYAEPHDESDRARINKLSARFPQVMDVVEKLGLEHEKWSKCNIE